jgi:uncharacterized protein YfkK (UPF0435 family)
MERQTPVFVRVEEYKDILDILDLIKNKIKESKKTIHEIHEIKNEEDNEMALWVNELAEIEKKIDFIDQTLLEPENV